MRARVQPPPALTQASRGRADYRGVRSKLRVIATGFAAVVFAVGLSVGAALAEDMTSHGPAPKGQQGSHWAPTGLCLLDGKTLRGDRP